MKYDVVLIGGGLSSLVCGISLQRAGKRCLMVSGGQNALHFSSGAFGLLGFRPDGSAVERPLEELDKLPENHPYRKVGAAKMHEYVNRVKPFFASCGVILDGDPERNSWRLTPTGTVRPSWLAMSDVTLYEDSVVSIGHKALIVNVAGYLDFNTAFLAEGLEKAGVTCRLEAVALPEFERLRTSASEMRSVNIARVMDHDQVWKKFVEQVCVLLRDEDVVVLPEVFGLQDEHVLEQIRECIPARVVFVGTMAPSVPGIRCQAALKTAFEQAGGEFLMGDEVVSARVEGGRVLSVQTANLGETVLEADHFVLATGGFFGRGLQASEEAVSEPVIGLDVDAPEERTQWYNPDFFAPQPYTRFGVHTSENLRAMKGGKEMENVYVIGSELGGADALCEGSGAGIAVMTGFKAAEMING